MALQMARETQDGLSCYLHSDSAVGGEDQATDVWSGGELRVE